MSFNAPINSEIYQRLVEISDLKHLSQVARDRSLSAEEKARLAEIKSNLTSEQVKAALDEGDQLQEVLMLRVDPETHETLPTAADMVQKMQARNTAQLAHTDEKIGDIDIFKAEGFNISEKLNTEFTGRGVNIRWWKHLVKDGNWTEAFKAALRFMEAQPWEGYKVLFFPPGDYLIDEQIYIYFSRFVLMSMNRHNTIIKLRYGAGINIGSTALDKRVNRFKILNLCFQPEDTGMTSDYCFRLDRATEGDFDDFSVENFKDGSGILFEDNCWSLKFDTARITHNKYGVHFNGHELNAIVFKKGMINDNQVGAYFDSKTSNDQIHGIHFIDGVQMETNHKAAVHVNSGRIHKLILEGYYELNGDGENLLFLARVDDKGSSATYNKRYRVHGLEIRGAYVWSKRDAKSAPIILDTTVNNSTLVGESTGLMLKNAKNETRLVKCIGSRARFLAQNSLLLEEYDGGYVFEHHLNEQGGNAKTIVNDMSYGIYSAPHRMQFRLGGNNLTLEQGGKFLTEGGIGVGNHSLVFNENIGWIWGKYEIFDDKGNSLGFVPIYRPL
ncbi:hypothetical protein [Shouchella patagoniensis]|uniref:hypothetical protein n=1 Tax=Shouchella patagoniensis TaxID=228576 RepID=UPI000995CB4A|nr:hypothetical protein [Shouchella patagoniensis]